MKNRWKIVLLLIASLVLFSACGPDYTEEYNQLSEKYNEMDAKWTALLNDVEAITENPPDFDETDAFYDEAIAHAESDLAELTEMSNTLDTYKDGINELDYEDFKAVLEDGISVTRIAIDHFTEDRSVVKANYVSAVYGTMVDEWNALSVDDMTAEIASDNQARMTVLSEKLESIKDSIDTEMYDSLRKNIDDALSVINDTINALD